MTLRRLSARHCWRDEHNESGRSLNSRVAVASVRVLRYDDHHQITNSTGFYNEMRPESITLSSP